MLNVLFFLVVMIQQGNHQNLDKTGLAMSGYDPVSYFMNGPKQGVDSYKTNFKGATYLFSSEENKRKFDSDPQKYIPEYGGWCAYALGLAPDKVKIDPNTYKVIDGKLYLFYNFKGLNTLDLWNKDEKSLLPEADKNWSRIVEK